MRTVEINYKARKYSIVSIKQTAETDFFHILHVQGEQRIILLHEKIGGMAKTSK